jgi:Spherulation-specific family 4
MMGWLRPSVLAAAGVLAVLAVTGITLSVKANSNRSISEARARNTVRSGVCEQLAVPAYFTAPYWIEAIQSKHPPADMILDITGVGAGTAPDAAMLYLVKKAQAAGVTVLGYSSTADGQRPIAQVEADVRNYASWYGVTSIFLDRVSGQSGQFSYYKQLADYIHAAHPGDQVWMNPGVYPDQDYMSIGDVVLVSEGTYAQYLAVKVPSWAIDYPAARFAVTIFATPKAALANALNTAEQRAAGHIFVTDLVGSNPYQGLPSYWSTEDADATVGCPGSG